jgi:putative ABC transport system permease protein
VPGVTHAEGWLLRDCWAGREPARCWGLPADTRLYQPVLRAGSWLDPRRPDEVVISEDLAYARSLGPGDPLTLQVGTEQRVVRIRGVVHDNSIFLGSTVTAKVFLPLPTMAPLINDRTRADLYALALEPRDLAGMEEVLRGLERRFAALQPSSEPALAEFEAAEAQTRILTAALRGMVLLVGIIGAIGLLNTLALNVLERRREIGVLRALGSDNLQIVKTFLTEGLTVGLLGWLLGVGFGWLFGRLFVMAMSTVLFGLPYVFPLSFVAAGLAFAMVLSLIASIAPAFAAASVPAAEALRYE